MKVSTVVQMRLFHAEWHSHQRNSFVFRSKGHQEAFGWTRQVMSYRMTSWMWQTVWVEAGLKSVKQVLFQTRTTVCNREWVFGEALWFWAFFCSKVANMETWGCFHDNWFLAMSWKRRFGFPTRTSGSATCLSWKEIWFSHQFRDSLHGNWCELWNSINRCWQLSGDRFVASRFVFDVWVETETQTKQLYFKLWMRFFEFNFKLNQQEFSEEAIAIPQFLA